MSTTPPVADLKETIPEKSVSPVEDAEIEKKDEVIKPTEEEITTSTKKRSLKESDADDETLESDKKKAAIASKVAEANSAVEDGKDKKEEEPEKEADNTTKKVETKDDKIDELETGKDAEKPKFVFGSTTSFGKAPAFSLFSEKKSIFDTDTNKEKEDVKSKEETTPRDTSSAKPVFGGGSSFGNAFQKALSKKSIFEQEPDFKKEDSENSETRESTASKDSVYQKVHLEKKEVTTGEEEEKTVFAVKSKLYTLDLTNVKEGWKEKGVGVLRLNKSNDSKYRLLMRADAILKVILNVPIVSKFEIFHGMESSLNGEKFLRFNFIENDKPVQYALKFGQADNATKLYKLVKEIS